MKLNWMRHVFMCAAFVVVGIPTVGRSDERSRPNRALTDDEAELVKKLGQEALEHYEAGRFAQGQAPARQAHEIRARVQGPTYWETTIAKSNLDGLTRIAALPAAAQRELHEMILLERDELPKLRQDGKFRDAIPVAARIVAVREQHLGTDSGLVARALNANGICCSEAGRYSDAEALFRRAIAAAEKTWGPGHPSTASAVGNLAICLKRQGQYRDAQKALEDVYAIRIEFAGPDSADTAIAANNLALNLEYQAQYKDAEKLHRRAIEILRRLSGRDNEDYLATSFTNLGVNLNNQHRNREAEKEHHAALDIRTRLYGTDHPETGVVLNNLGVCLAEQGRYAEALPLYRKTIVIYSNVLGEEHPWTLGTYNNLALALSHQGKLKAAEFLFRRILHLKETPAGEEDTDIARWYNNLATNLQAQDRLRDAETLFHKALDIQQRLLTADHPDIAVGHNNLAALLFVQDRYPEAEVLLRKARGIVERKFGERHTLTAETDSNLAIALHHQGKYREAETILRRAVAVLRDLSGEQYPRTARAYKSLLTTLWALGDYAGAEALGPAAAQALEAARQRVSYSGLERAGFAHDYSSLPLIAALAARNGNATAAWDYLESDLARGLLDDLSSRRLTDAERQRERLLQIKVNEIEEKKIALLNVPKLSDAAREKIAALSKEGDATQKELSEFQAEMARKHGVPAGEVYGLKRIQPQLADDDALVAWVDFTGPRIDGKAKGEHWACVVRRKGAPVWVPLAGADSWTADDGQLGVHFRKECAERPAKDRERWKGLAHKLYDQRIKPIEAQLRARDGLSEVRNLIILPSPRLSGVPIEAMTEEVVPGRYAVSYAPSGTMFAWLREKRAESERGGRPAESPSLLAVGDPVFAPQAPQPAEPTPPDHGVLVTLVSPDSNAERSGLKAGDLILQYAGVKLKSQAELGPAIKAHSADAKVTAQLWRDGKTLELSLKPGPLGVMLSNKPAEQAVRSQRELEQLLRLPVGDGFTRLRGAEWEMFIIPATFRSGIALRGSDASEQRLLKLVQEGGLSQYRYLHFATHGVLDLQSPMRSALVLSQDRLPDALAQAVAGNTVYSGRVTAEQILRNWRLDADLVTLSACETGLGKFTGGEGYVGFSQALFLAGARGLLLSLWQVDDTSTALLMTRFYENVLGRRAGLTQPMSKAAALAEAKAWLRRLTPEEVQKITGGLSARQDTEVARGKRVPKVAQPGAAAPVYPFDHPYYWSGFILIGDPK